jgi:hypothetical protein
MNTVKKASLILLAFGTLLTSLVPQARADYTTVHKVTENGVTTVFFPATANTQVAVKTSKLPTTSLLTLNNCGWAKISNSATAPVVNITGGSTNFAGKTSGAPPVCVKQADGTYFDSNSAAAVGTVVDASTVLWIKGGSGLGTLTVDVTKQAVINATANACGFAKLTANATRPLTSFMVGTTSYTLSGVSSMPATQICKGTTLYRPVASGS